MLVLPVRLVACVLAVENIEYWFARHLSTGNRAPQLAQLCNDNPDILLLKVDFDENRDIVKPLAIRVRPCLA